MRFWGLWWRRNGTILENVNQSTIEVTRRAITDLEDWKSVCQRSRTTVADRSRMPSLYDGKSHIQGPQTVI